MTFFNFKLGNKSYSEANNILRALDHSLATIEFDMNGNILTANENFLKLMDYQLHEVKGKHHSILQIRTMRKVMSIKYSGMN